MKPAARRFMSIMLTSSQRFDTSSPSLDDLFIHHIISLFPKHHRTLLALHTDTRIPDPPSSCTTNMDSWSCSTSDKPFVFISAYICAPPTVIIYTASIVSFSFTFDSYSLGSSVFLHSPRSSFVFMWCSITSLKASHYVLALLLSYPPCCSSSVALPIYLSCLPLPWTLPTSLSSTRLHSP